LPLTRLVDVVNFNADASCLAAGEWLAILKGGERSRLCRWLGIFVELRRPVVLGFIGGAIADMAAFNPEAIALINANPSVFDLVLRPFSHDVGLLRSERGFILNLNLGRAVARREFSYVNEFFLPPEFMLTNSQVKNLADHGSTGTFLNPTRFKEEIRQRLPKIPFTLEGVLGSQLPCIPFEGTLTLAYLDALHNFDPAPWAEAVRSAGVTQVFTWRDGESCFLVPDGIERERHWLAGEPSDIQRETLRSALNGLHFASSHELPADTSRSYPVHSFSAWFKEFRMLGFLDRLARIEARLDTLPRDLLVVWLQAINSDILSAVEKDSPIISLLSLPGSGQTKTLHTIWRSERGFEGEDYLALLEAAVESPDALSHLWTSTKPHFRKLRARIEYVRRLEDGIASAA
jgi:hypothetical protein